MITRGVSIAIALIANLLLLPPAFAQTDFEDMTSAQKLEARNAAAKMHMEEIKFCADGGNLPFSNRKGEGFENKIAEIIANAVGAQLTYYWRPSLERGATRAVFDNSVCDVLIDIPANWEGALTTLPLYRTTYVLAYRSDKGIAPFKSLDDPRLKSLRVGVYETSALREALANRGVTKVDVHPVTYDGDLVQADEPWWQVEQVAKGDLDVAAVWGPFAGYVKTKRGEPLTIQPVNRMDDTIPLEFDLALGVRSTDAVLKYMLDDVMQKHRDEIRKVLEDYGVPLVECGSCIISGNIPAHGTYFTPAIHLTKPTDTTTGEAPHVADATVNQWLKDGLDLNSALNGAVVDSDLERIRYLVSKGADVNSHDGLGQYLLHIAAEQRDMDVISELLDDGANIEVRDNDGWTPLMHAASSDNVPAIQLLVAHKAQVDATTPDGYTALAYALADGHFAAAQALVDAGASVSRAVGPEQLTPLMITASELPPRNRMMALVEGVNVVDMTRLLVTKGADVNAKSSAGMSALMVAAVHNNPSVIGVLAQLGADLSARETGGRTARELAVLNDNQAAAQILDVLAATSPKSKRSDPTARAEGKTL